MTAPPPAKVGFDRRQSIIAALLFTVLLLNYLDRQVFSIIFTEMKKDLGFTQWQYTMAVNAFLLAYGFMYVGSGMILDRIGARVGMAVFVAAWSLVSGLHGFVNGFALLIALRFLLGVTEPGGWTGSVKTVSERFSSTQRGLASGIFTSGAGVGSLVAPPLLVFLTIHFGWRSTFVVTGLLGLLWIPFWLQATKTPVLTPAAPASGHPWLQVWELLRDKRAMAFVATRFFGDSTGYFLMFWLPQHLVQNKKFSFAMLGLLGWIPYMIKDAGAIAGGYASSRMVQRGWPAVYSRKVMMSIAAVLVIGGAALESRNEIPLVLACLILASFGMGLWSGNFHSIPADGFEHRKVATVHGLAGSFGAIGGILFNTLVGYLMSTGQIWAVFLTLALLMPCGVLPLWIWLPNEAVATEPAAKPVQTLGQESIGIH